MLDFISPVVIVSLAAWVITHFIRKVVEKVAPQFAKGSWWTDILLPAVPANLGALIAYLAKAIPFPMGLNDGTGRVLTGLVAGFFSAYVYRAVRARMKAAGVELPGEEV